LSDGHVDAVPRVDGDRHRDDLSEFAFGEDLSGAAVGALLDVLKACGLAR
jgi:hypothetical protein